MGMGLMDAIARATRGGGGGMGMMAAMQAPGAATPAPAVSKQLVQALLAKHGAAPAPAMGGPDPLAPLPAMGGPDMTAPMPVSLTDAAPAPQPSLTAGLDRLPTGDFKSGGGLLSRIGDFLHSDEGRAALLRSGAATLQGGLGAGIEAGAGFVDQRRHERAAGAQAATENAMREKQLSNTYNLGLGRLNIDASNADETGRHNRAGEGIDRSRVLEDYAKHTNPSGDARLRTEEDRFEHVNPSGTAVLNEQGANYRHDAVSGDTAATQAGENMRNTQDNQTQVMRDRLAHAPTISMHTHYQTTPEEYARNGPRLRVSQVQPDAAGGATQIGSDAEYAALPSGARFMGPDRQVRIKP